MDYPKLYQVRYVEVEGGDEEFVREGGKWEWASLDDAMWVYKMFYLNRIFKKKNPVFDLYITETPEESDEDEFDEQFGIEYPEPVVSRPEMKFDFAGSAVFEM